MDILVYRYPDALISHRSAKEIRPTATGDFFLTGSTSRRVTDLPGITLNIVNDPKNYLAACNAYEEPSQAKLQKIDRSIH